MIVMLFEYKLREEHIEEYKRHAGSLRQLVHDINGFMSIESFRSDTDPTKILAIGYFRDEEAVKAWRNLPQHREAQILGREIFFTEYHLCMAEVIRDYSMKNREQIPDDSRIFHESSIGQ